MNSKIKTKRNREFLQTAQNLTIYFKGTKKNGKNGIPTTALSLLVTAIYSEKLAKAAA